jgi:hypothetical protein
MSTDWIHLKGRDETTGSDIKESGGEKYGVIDVSINNAME